MQYEGRKENNRGGRNERIILAMLDERKKEKEKMKTNEEKDIGVIRKAIIKVLKSNIEALTKFFAAVEIFRYQSSR